MVVVKSGPTLDSPVRTLPNLRPSDTKRLAGIGIRTVRDLLLTLPFGWESYGQPRSVAELSVGTGAAVIGTISAVAPRITLRKRMQLTQATLIDESGRALRLVWFNQPWVAKQLAKGDRVAVAGMPRIGYGGMWEM